jgi:hypothetical protein
MAVAGINLGILSSFTSVPLTKATAMHCDDVTGCDVVSDVRPFPHNHYNIIVRESNSEPEALISLRQTRIKFWMLPETQ